MTNVKITIVMLLMAATACAVTPHGDTVARCTSDDPDCVEPPVAHTPAWRAATATAAAIYMDNGLAADCDAPTHCWVSIHSGDNVITINCLQSGDSVGCTISTCDLHSQCTTRPIEVAPTISTIAHCTDDNPNCTEPPVTHTPAWDATNSAAAVYLQGEFTAQCNDAGTHCWVSTITNDGDLTSIDCYDKVGSVSCELTTCDNSGCGREPI